MTGLVDLGEQGFVGESDDALDLARHLAQRGHQWFSGGNGPLIESYLKGDLYIEAGFRWHLSSSHEDGFKFGVATFFGGEKLFALLKERWPNLAIVRLAVISEIETRSRAGVAGYHWQENAVLVSDVELMEGIECVIPSFVRLEIFDDSDEFFRRLADFSHAFTFEGGLVRTYGKVSGLSAVTIKFGGGDSDVVKRASEIVDRISHDESEAVTERVRDTRSHPYPSLRLLLSEGFVGAFVEKDSPFRIEVCQMLARSFELGVRPQQPRVHLNGHETPQIEVTEEMVEAGISVCEHLEAEGASTAYLVKEVYRAMQARQMDAERGRSPD